MFISILYIIAQGYMIQDSREECSFLNLWLLSLYTRLSLSSLPLPRQGRWEEEEEGK